MIVHLDADFPTKLQPLITASRYKADLSYTKEDKSQKNRLYASRLFCFEVRIFHTRRGVGVLTGITEVFRLTPRTALRLYHHRC
jgi:hypothetical protein